jgi:peroxiredoxin
MSRVTLAAQAPDFSLTSWQQIPTRLSDFRGQRNVILIFNRGFT